MDNRRLSTADILASGIYLRTPPETEIPEDRETVSGADRDSYSCIPEEQVIAALEAGKIVESPNYYGIPHVWKQAEGVYRGALLQYCNVTEDPTFTTAQEAAEWFRDRYFATDG
jgi:hypothetical protein